MVNDDELNRHVRRLERDRTASPEVAGRIDELESTARCVHNELARRIESTAAESADVERLEALEQRLASVERRLDRLEAAVTDRTDPSA
jgi:DNA repair ATPase RecN